MGASSYTELIALIDLIYEAALDNDLCLLAHFRLTLANLHCRMRLWRRVSHTSDHFVAAARDFFVAVGI